MKFRDVHIVPAFTLVEMMAALAIASTIALVLIAGFGQTHRATSAMRMRLAANQDVDRLLDMLEEDCRIATQMTALSDRIVFSVDKTGDGSSVINISYIWNQSQNSLDRLIEGGPTEAAIDDVTEVYFNPCYKWINGTRCVEGIWLIIKRNSEPEAISRYFELLNTPAF